MSLNKTEQIARLNDLCRFLFFAPVRTQYMGKEFKFKLILTQGIADLPSTEILPIFRAVRDFTAFTEGDNPHGERDFGAFTHNDQKIFWKIDYYDNSLAWGSEDPTDLENTVRVLTIMLAEEY